MKFTVTTGYGYVLKSDGTFDFKYEQFMPGEHIFPDDSTVIEVSDSVALNTLPLCNPPLSIDQQLAALDAQYQPQFDRLSNSYMVALMNNDAATMGDVKAEYDALQTAYNNAKAAIQNA